MKIYIAGKITGEPDYYENFQRAMLKLRMQGNTVITPTILPDGLTHDEYMHICMSLIDVAEAVYFLSNWMESEGAREEFRYANHTGKMIMYEREPAHESVESNR
jgi:hypothetical protein